MPLTPSPAHPLNRLGLVLLIAALICWIGFHFFPIDSNSRGWELWGAIWEMFTRGDQLQWDSMIGISAFVTIAILVTAAPFVTPLLRSSPPFRWLAITVSGAALLGLGSLILKDASKGPAAPLFLSAMALNFCGLICLRAPRLEMGREPS